MSTIDFNQIVYLGDSYTDAGRVDSFFLDVFGFPSLPADLGYFEGRVSNGPTYADLTPSLLGLDESASLNFAVAGAAAITDRTVGDFLGAFAPLLGIEIPDDADPELLATRIDIAGQVGSFLSSDAAEGDLSDTAVSLFFGINDQNFFDPAVGGAFDPTQPIAPQVEVFADIVADQIFAGVATLTDAGVGTIILQTVPDNSDFFITNTPSFDPVTRDMLSQLDDALNEEIRERAAELQEQGLNVKLVDFGVLFDEVNGNLGTFGFQVDLGTPAIAGELFPTGPNPDVDGIPLDQIPAFDNLHPSAALHETMAIFHAESITSDVQIGDDGRDFLRGGRDDDLILGRDGNDFLSLGKGDDVGLGGMGNDYVTGGRGDDLLSGGSGDDILKGDRGDDLIADGEGDDLSSGGNGNDILIDGAGSDVLLGGRGSDTFIFTDQSLLGGDSSGDENLFVGGRGHDTLVLRLNEGGADKFSIDYGPRGQISIDELGISARGIEEIVFVDGLDVPTDTIDVALYNEAELWGFA